MKCYCFPNASPNVSRYVIYPRDGSTRGAVASPCSKAHWTTHLLPEMDKHRALITYSDYKRNKKNEYYDRWLQPARRSL